MPFVLMSLKLAAYLFCISTILKHSHRLSARLGERIMSAGGSPLRKSLLASLATTLPLLLTSAATLAFALFTQPDPLPMLGLLYDGDSLSFAWSGIVLGFTCVMLMFSVGLLLGFIKVSKGITLKGDNAASFWAGSSDYLTGAVLEEIVIRGYTYYALNEVLGWSPAIAISATIFALAHLRRPNRIPFVFTVNALLFGLLTGACRYATGSLWLPIGLHIAWNVTAGPILGMPYCGEDYDRGLVRCDVSGPLWLMGGAYSPDAGMLGTCALVVAAVGLSLLAPML